MIYQPYFRFAIILFMSLEFDIIHLSNGKYALRLQRLLNSASVVQQMQIILLGFASIIVIALYAARLAYITNVKHWDVINLTDSVPICLKLFDKIPSLLIQL